MSYRYVLIVFSLFSIFNSQCDKKELTLDGKKINEQPVEKIELFRDVSWRVYSAHYYGNSFYTCLPKAYEDKVTILEERVTGKNSIFKKNYIFLFLGGLIPIKWNINYNQTTIWNFDPFDALTLGVQAANPEIIQAALDTLPISRAAAPSGFSIEFRNKKIKYGKDKFDVTQLLTLTFESLDSKINRFRIIKAIAVPGAILSWFGFTTNTFHKQPICSEGLEINEKIGSNGIIQLIIQQLQSSKKSNDRASGKSLEANTTERSSDDTPNSDSGDTKSKKEPLDKSICISQLKYLTLAASLTTTFIAQKLEQAFIQNHIKIFDLLINSKKVTYNKDQVKILLNRLYKKIRFFGLHKKEGEKLQALIERA